MMATRLHRVCSSLRMWEEMMMVLPRRCSSCRMAIISMRARGSRPLAGSSSSSNCGSWISTRARPEPLLHAAAQRADERPFLLG